MRAYLPYAIVDNAGAGLDDNLLTALSTGGYARITLLDKQDLHPYQ